MTVEKSVMSAVFNVSLNPQVSEITAVRVKMDLQSKKETHFTHFTHTDSFKWTNISVHDNLRTHLWVELMQSFPLTIDLYTGRLKVRAVRAESSLSS